MTGLPKKYAKMGFKKGWRAFKASKRKRSTTRRRPVKRRVRRVRRMARRKTKYRKVYKAALNEKDVFIGVIGEQLADRLVTQFAPQLNVSDDLIKLAGGYFFKKKKGTIGKVAKVIYIIQLYKLSRGIIRDMNLGGLIGSPKTVTPKVGW